MEIIPNWHPLLVHFTIALYVVSTTLFVIGYFLLKNKWKEKFVTTAYMNLWLGALMTVFTVAAGIYAYNTVQHDAPSHLAMTDHKNWALATAGLFWAIALWSVYIYRMGKGINLFFVIVILIGMVMLGVTGFKGGDIVYRYGLGVMSLPQTSGDGHEHSPGEAHGNEPPSTPAPHNAGDAAPHEHDVKKPEKPEHSEMEHDHNHTDVP
ncbi:DUF2231 domain-containing protein [Paremcibacter congregatus]|uniref:DUF2231 domain-containing protein n=1 Tax=Paremcibacter congregatus TaxID=2043170 RepID=UPI0030EE9FBC|tara:strand:- start:418 stop:1041 length:624 start_codon:yes stop_codon:yes gene_type:complete